MQSIGWCAVSSDGGRWEPKYTKMLQGRPVCVVGQCADIGALRAAGCKVLTVPGQPGSIAHLVSQAGPEAAASYIVQQMYQDNEQHALASKSAADLMREQLPPVAFAVNGLIPQGLTVLAAPSKYGKSWMVLDMCLSVTAGCLYLGHTTNKSECLYLALEDSYQRLQSRLNKLLRSKPAPAGLHLTISAPDMDNGLISQLDGFTKAHPNTKLIVIDTLQKVRGVAKGREGAYANDYREIGRLKAFADAHGVALLLVHHLRKMVDDDDPYNRISGTSAIMGAADAALVITKAKREDASATLWVTGRDVEEAQTIIRFDKDSCRWDSLGDAEQYAAAQARAEYTHSPVVRTICKLVDQAGPKGWTGTTRQLMDAGLFITGQSIATTAQSLARELSMLSPLLAQYDGIVHERKSNGSGGGKHLFSRFCNVYELDQTAISNDTNVCNVCNVCNDTNDTT